MASSMIANARPSKYFFCRMLTRDIELKDAILDLIDNCIDGAIRRKGVPPSDGDDAYYKDFRVDISLGSERFAIEDNCGGIPYETALNYAFRFGAEEREEGRENALPTIGLYGIGMKRAIFKIGTGAVVTTRTSEDGSYRVTIPKDWMRLEAWEFPLERTDEEILRECGTRVEISLNPDIEEFSPGASLKNFTDDLNRTIAEHFGIVMQKGLEISLNGCSIGPIPVSFLFSENTDEEGAGRYAPYLFAAKIYGVEVRMAVGFYGKKTMPTQEELDAELEEPKRSSQDAGWTVVCNDRVVLYNNRDHLTGWGENGAPKYHPQFIGIKGIVSFRSNDPSLLPTTTSKRGIDANSSVYAAAKKRMCDGLKIFTGYTNKWKGSERQEKERANEAPLKSSRIFLRDHDDIARELHIEFSPTRNSEEEEGVRFAPKLPLPASEKKGNVRFVFWRPRERFELLKERFFEGEDVSPGKIGEFCFDQVFDEVQSEEAVDGR